MKIQSIIISIFLFILLVSRIATPQVRPANLEIPIIATDGISLNWDTLKVGLDTTATDCLDPHLEEFELPPIPPTGLFLAVLELPSQCGFVHTFKDYRNAPSFPFTGSKEHKLRWQLGSGATAFTIIYDFPFGVSANIKDPFGGVLFNQNLSDSGSYTITFPIGQANLTMNYNFAGGDPAGPLFGMTPSTLNFPQTIIGVTDSLPLTVTNSGLLNTLVINDIQISNNNFIVSPNTTPLNISPGSSQTFYVSHTADTIAEQGIISFVHNAPGTPAILNVSSPEGLHPGPIFNVSSTNLIFPQRPPGTLVTLPLRISNGGHLNPLIINSIISSNNYFTVQPNSFPIEVQPQSYRIFEVTYTSSDTLQNGTMEFSHNAAGSPAIIHVSSDYTDAEFSISPASLYFTSQPETQFVTVSNNGILDSLIIVDIISSNSNYTFSPHSLPVSLPPGSEMDFFITLNDEPGPQTGFIEFYHSAPGSPYSLPVTNQSFIPLIEGRIDIISGNLTGYLLFGLDPLATDDIDQVLGEYELPPPCPPTCFEWRLILPENNFSVL